MLGVNFRKRSNAAANLQDDEKLGGSDRLMILGAMLKDLGTGGTENIAMARQIADQNRKYASARAAALAQSEIPNILTGRTNAKVSTGAMGPAADGSEPAAQSVPFAQRRALLPNLRDPEVIRRLAEVEARGGDPSTALEILKANQASVKVGPGGEGYDEHDSSNVGRIFRAPTVINDTIVDANNPKNEERQVPKVGEGRMLVWDQQGKPYVMDIPNYAESEARRAGLKAGAEAGARTPYETVTGTDRQGRPVLTRKSDVTGTEGQPLVGQSPAEAIEANKAAEAAAERRSLFQKSVDEDAKLSPLLDEMEGLLDGGDVISGMGAELRLGGERALALTGDERAKSRVAATEAWQNLTKRQVLPLVKQLGTGSGITDADRKFTEAIVAGDIELSEATMRRVIGIGRRQIEANRKRFEGERAASQTQSPGRAAPRTTGRGYRILSVE
jgi:hypothetical protein